MKRRFGNVCVWFGGLLMAAGVGGRPLAAQQPPSELPAASPAAGRTAAEGLGTPAATLGYALGLRDQTSAWRLRGAYTEWLAANHPGPAS